MAATQPETLLKRIAPGERLLVDTSVALSYLTGTESASRAATDLFDGCIATGRNAAVMSAVSLAELLVRPFARGAGAVAIVEGFLRHFGDIAVRDVTYDVARDGARLRAATGVAMPDALIIATALIERVDRVVTNDGAWRRLLADVEPGLSVLSLNDDGAREDATYLDHQGMNR